MFSLASASNSPLGPAEKAVCELRKRFRTRQQREDWRKKLVFIQGACANARSGADPA